MGSGFSIQWTEVLRSPNLLARPELRGINLTPATAPYFDEAFQAILTGLNEAEADPEILLWLQNKVYELQRLVGGKNSQEKVEQGLIEISVKLGRIDVDRYAVAFRQTTTQGGGILRFAPSAYMTAQIEAQLKKGRREITTRFAWTRFPGEYVIVGEFTDPDKAGQNPVILHHKNGPELATMLARMQQKEGPIASITIAPEGTPLPPPAIHR